MKVAFFTLGCKVNQYETDVMRSAFESKGYTTVSDDESADIYIVNSCTVTSVADKKSRQKLRHFKRNSPESIVVLTGCYAQVYSDKAKEIEEADIIIGTKERSKVPEIIENYLKDRQRVINIKQNEKDEKFESMTCSTFYEKTRAFIKIEDGCNRFCSYCAIPLARGRVRSKPLDELENELKLVSKAGYKEVVLVGINLACYGQDINCRLIDAVRLAVSIDGIERVRLGSFEPEMLIESDLEEMATFSKLCPHFHISLQSGSTETLKRMHRHYNSDEYLQIVNLIRKYFESPAITTDVIVGFPGETDEEFKESCDFVKKVGFSKVHIFPYSRRAGTLADKMPDQIDNATKAERAKILQRIADKSESDFLESKIGKTVKILAETGENGYICGFTSDYVPVKIKSDNFNSLQNTFVCAKIKGKDKDCCIGELV